MPYYIKAKKALVPSGRFRGGQHHSTTGRIWPDDAFSVAQLKAISKDPILTVEKLSKADAEKKAKTLGLTADPETGPEDGAASPAGAA